MEPLMTFEQLFEGVLDIDLLSLPRTVREGSGVDPVP